ncbi:hypothetical protein [Micromonospora craterilacus]|nr:hypothetical protein [Micromonospora craterilacus]
MTDQDKRDRDEEQDDGAGRRGVPAAPADRQARKPRDRQAGPEVNR